VKNRGRRSKITDELHFSNSTLPMASPLRMSRERTIDLWAWSVAIIMIVSMLAILLGGIHVGW
jgi:hypothetical protein